MIPRERPKRLARASSPPGKLADAEVNVEAGTGPLAGLHLIGFAVCERRDGGRNVAFPVRVYSVNGERRNFELLRPITRVSYGSDVARR